MKVTVTLKKSILPKEIMCKSVTVNGNGVVTLYDPKGKEYEPFNKSFFPNKIEKILIQC